MFISSCRLFPLTILVVLILAATGCTSGGPREEPSYSLVESVPDGDIEVRIYPPLNVAEIEAIGTREAALREGFRLLAEYIHGNNEDRIPMDVGNPVIQQQGFRISVTAPQQGLGDSWYVRFVMPASIPLNDLPAPSNTRIKLKQIPGDRFVSITFSGRWTDENLNRHLGELDAFVRAKKMAVKGTPTLVFYDPPWSIPSARRNEILLSLGN